MGEVCRKRRMPAFALTLLAMLSLAAPTVAHGVQTRRISATPATAVASSSLDRPLGAAPADDPLVGVIVKLADAPLATYTGTIPGLPATSPRATGKPRLESDTPASQRYLEYLDQKQHAFANAARALIPQARITARYRHVFGGVAMVAPESQVPRIAKLPGVVSVQRDRLRQPVTDRSPTFIGADVIWRALAADPAPDDGGEGVIVGVIDTGIWPEHPSFADDGSYPPPPARWHGGCEAPRDISPAIVCTHKLIGARAFLDTYKALIGLQPSEFDSARDNDGHGTHTASTAAGNANVAATIYGQPRGTISGVAPRAYVAAYKGLGALGGFGADLVAAIDQAVADGVDVINYSIGSTLAVDPYTDADSLAFLDAYQAGVFVAVAAGNAGPDPGSIGSPANAPWVTSVAASTTDRQFISQLTLQAGQEQITVPGVSVTPGVAGKQVIDAATLDDPYCRQPLPATVANRIVLCRRGENARVAKGANVKAGGGAGMVLYNTTTADVEADNHWVPTIHLNGIEGTQVISFTRAHSSTAILGTIGPSTATTEARFGDVVAAFSSRGPLPDDQIGISKPDIAAPGVQILAAHTPYPGDPLSGPAGELFQTLTGTSMAAPHVAGSAALLKALHPAWTPGQIKSALMTTAQTRLLKQDGVTPADPYDVGAGRLDLARAGDPGLTFDIPAEAYASGRGHLADLNYPSISIPSLPGRISVTRVVKSELGSESVWDTAALAPEGITISVTPPQIRVPAYGLASFVVTIDASQVPAGAHFASLLLRSGERGLHMPISFNRSAPVVALKKTCDPAAIAVAQVTTCTTVATNNSPDEATISMRDVMPSALAIDPATVSGGRHDPSANSVRFADRLPGVVPVNVDVAVDTTRVLSGYLSLASLGIPPATCTERCDDDAISYIAPAFTYGGRQYDRVTMVTNGYLIVGDAKDINIFNQRFPDPGVPNNVIAPYWTDLDLDGTLPDDTGGGAWYAAYVTLGDDPTQWFVAEWSAAAKFRADPTASQHTFQVWIKGGGDRAYLVYGPNSAPEDGLTVGAENADGTAGENIYVDIDRDGVINGTGTVPVEGDQLVVTTTPEQRSSHTISYQARGLLSGTYLTTAELTSNLFMGTHVTTATVTVGP